MLALRNCTFYILTFTLLVCLGNDGGYVLLPVKSCRNSRSYGQGIHVLSTLNRIVETHHHGMQSPRYINLELKYVTISPPISKVLNLIVFKRMKELDVILAGPVEEVALSIFLGLKLFILPFDVQQMRKDERNLGLKHFRPIKPLGCGDTGRFSLS